MRAVRVACWIVFLPATLGHAEDRFPTELIHWKPMTSAPIFTGAGAGHWDAKIRERGWILPTKTGYRLWYTGYDGRREGIKLLGSAVSTDGLTWRRESANPLITDHWVEDMMVVATGGRYHMFAEGVNDEAQHLTSVNGLAWEKQGKLAVRRKDGTPIADGPYGTPTVWLENDVWHLFYERRDAGVWLATSTDLKTWRNDADDPVLSPGPASCDRRLIAMNQIVRVNDRYYALYHGRGDGPEWSTCLAQSADLRKWVKYPQNPIVGGNRSSGILVPVGAHYRLYTLHDRVEVFEPATPR